MDGRLRWSARRAGRLIAAVAPAVLGAAACATTHPPGHMYTEGTTFEEYLPHAAERNELWRTNWEGSVVPDEVLEAFRAREGSAWHLLAVVHPGCSDSMSTIPHLARLADEVEGLELRLVDPERGRSIMEAHRTPDDRSATPTVLLLDENLEVAGCWVEQPSALQTWWLGEARGLPAGERFEKKMAWYAEDAGRGTFADWLRIFGAAGEGRMICPGAIDGNQ
jgi:hypothetical protein